MITGMDKLLLMGLAENKERVLSNLQKAGLVEIEPYKGSKYSVDGREVSSVRAELIIWSYKTVTRYASTAEKAGFSKNEYPGNPAEIVDKIPLLDREYRKCKEEITLLQNKLKFIEPWGEFSLKDIREIEKKGNVTVQFWDVAQKNAHEVKTEGAIAEIEIYQGNDRKYFVTFADKPIKIKHCTEVNYDLDPTELKNKIVEQNNRVNEVLQELLNIFSRKTDIYKYYLEELNKVNFNKAVRGSVHDFDGKIFIFQAWCPTKDIENLKKTLADETVTVIPVEPEENERIPTFVDSKNNLINEMGLDLVNIYDVPSHKDWDPSAWVFFSFAIFFAMIVGDGGYGLLLLVLMIFLKIKVNKPGSALNRFFNLSIALSGATAVYGLLTASFFGLNISDPAFPVLNPLTRLLKSINLIDTSDDNTMMLVSIIIGIFHTCISLILKGLRAAIDDKDYITPFINIAWIAAMWAFYFWYKYDGVAGAEHLTQGGMTALKISGGALVLFYAISAKTFNPFKMVFTSFFGLYNSIQFFSDVLSYIRIFALGLSGALLAQTFNSLAFDLWNIGIFGMIVAPVIFVAGHALNIVLCIMGGVIHGLRLNFLEWYRWSFDGGGKKFVPLRDLLKAYVKTQS